jgi:hypothetical protein
VADFDWHGGKLLPEQELLDPIETLRMCGDISAKSAATTSNLTEASWHG